ncbi:MAG: S8 family serine peptidase [Deltaproteobacteria bacterium]|nr:S8 family serine peptidase [Deltaproteobacteria bacterium]
MTQRVVKVLLALCWWLLVAPGGSQAEPSSWRDKVDPSLLEESRADQQGEFLLLLDEQADLSDLKALRDRRQRGARVVERLRELAEGTQAGLIAELDRSGAEYRSFWAANMIWVRGSLGLLPALASSTRVARVLPNPQVGLKLPEEVQPDAAALEGIESNLMLVRAPEVWALGYTGQGVVIGGADTGYEWTHPALMSQYRGWNGVSADHAYSWHDAIHTSVGSCGADAPAPCDDHDHGTHTMGTMLGDDGGANQIGMAPGARWIGCRNMDGGLGTPARYTECFQWFMAPTDAEGQNPDPTKAPHIINNSWYCPPSEGCVDPMILETVVENTRAAGILVVVSAGNSGPSCASVDAPPAIYDASFSVGATDDFDGIASFSSRGPVEIDGSMRLKPDVSAPGVGIRSSRRGGDYRIMSGTSMAGPHVAGLAALLISAHPELAGDVDALEAAITSRRAGGRARRRDRTAEPFAWSVGVGRRVLARPGVVEGTAYGERAEPVRSEGAYCTPLRYSSAISPASTPPAITKLTPPPGATQWPQRKRFPIGDSCGRWSSAACSASHFQPTNDPPRLPVFLSRVIGVATSRTSTWSSRSGIPRALAALASSCEVMRSFSSLYALPRLRPGSSERSKSSGSARSIVVMRLFPGGQQLGSTLL